MQIENNTDRLILLPPTDSFPQGIRLVPGLNNVPDKFLAEFQAYSVQPEPDKAGKARPVRYPGKETLESLQEHVKIITTNGESFGPQITLFTEDQVGREEGPPAPLSLTDYNVDTAVAIVKATKDPKALERWSSDKREKVASAARERR